MHAQGLASGKAGNGLGLGVAGSMGTPVSSEGLGARRLLQQKTADAVHRPGGLVVQIVCVLKRCW